MATHLEQDHWMPEPEPLFYHAFPRSEKVLDSLGPVRERHQGKCDYVSCDSGIWVRKRAHLDEHGLGRAVVAAEAIGWSLSGMIGGRMPRAQLVLEPEGPAWLSEVLSPKWPWDPSFADRYVNTSEVAAMLLLDAILAVEDRHEENVLMQPPLEPDEGWTLWTIDYGDAEVSRPDKFLSIGPTGVPDPGAPMHIRLGDWDALAEPLLAKASLLRAISRYQVQRVVYDAFHLAGLDRAIEVSDLLLLRIDAAPDLAVRYLDRLRDLP